MVEFSGHFDGRVITPDEQVEIPVNIPLRVTIELALHEASRTVDWQRLLKLADDCAVQGPANLAARHDYYAHGKVAE